jgi:hypothetical protein
VLAPSASWVEVEWQPCTEGMRPAWEAIRMTEPPGNTNETRMMDDPRLAFIYAEALRSLQVQLAHLESLHARGGTLIFAASFASSLLGGQALSNGLGSWDWLALSLLVGIGLLAVVILWPYYNVQFRFDVAELLGKYVDGPRAVSVSEMHRDLALQLRSYMESNGRLIRRTREALQVAFILLLLEIVAWLLSIGGL